MFTGLVEEKGALVRREPRGPGARLAIRCTLAKRAPLEMGESISVDGCCLSVVAISGDGFEVDASAETLARTTLGDLRAGSEVNLERAAQLGQRMGGHIVTGHVDGVGTVVSREPLGDAVKMAFDMPAPLARYVAEKGSITVGGVSLTVNHVQNTRFEVAVIPITLKVTTLGALGVGSRVNLEVDILARYVARILEAGAESGDAAWLERLKKAGYA